MKPLTIEQKIFLLLILIGILANIFTNGAKAQTVRSDSTGNFIMIHKAKADDKPIGKTLTIQDGQKLPIYVSTNGKYYVIRTSKKGNQYKSYLKIQ